MHVMPYLAYRVVVDRANDVTYVVTPDGELSRYSAAFGLSIHPDVLALNSTPDPTVIRNQRRAAAIGIIDDQRSNLRAAYRVVPFSPHFQRLQIETTLTCNLKCSYCYCEAGPVRHEALSIEHALAAIDDADKLGCLYVDLTGGELFAYRYWRELATEVRRRSIVLSVHTNGLLLDESRIDALLSIGTSRVLVAIESHLPKIHDTIRGRSGALLRTAQNIRRAVDAGLNVHASLMVHRLNRETLADTMKWLIDDLGVAVAFDRITEYGRQKSPSSATIDSHHQSPGIALTTAEFYEAVAPYLGRLDKPITERRICDSGEGVRPDNVVPHCGVAHNFAFITAEGEIALCPTMTSRESARFKGPNLARKSLYEAWTEDSLFISHRFLNCRNASRCPSGSACGGGCRSNAYAETGELDSPDYLECNVHKNKNNSFIDFSRLYSQGIFDLANGNNVARNIEIGRGE